MNNEIREIFVKILRGIWDILRTAADVRLKCFKLKQIAMEYNIYFILMPYYEAILSKLIFIF